MISLHELRAATDRYAALPEPLRALLLRERGARRLTAIALGVILFVVAVAVFVFEYSPPLSREEKQFLTASVLTVLASPLPALYAFKSLPPALWALVDEDVVWVYRKIIRGGRQYLVFASDRGVMESLRLDEDGVALSEAMVAEALLAIRALHPEAYFGHTPDLEAAWRRNPASLRRSGTPRPATRGHTFYKHRRTLALLALVGVPIVAFMVVPMVLLVASSSSSGPLKPPTFGPVTLTTETVSFVVHTSPRATIVSPYEQFRRADETGTAEITLHLAELRQFLGADTRALEVLVYNENEGRGSGLSATLLLPKTVEQAQDGAP